MPRTRSGKDYTEEPIVTKKRFNMLGRAVAVDSASRLYTANANIILMATEWNVPTVNRAVTLTDMYTIAEELKQANNGKTYLLIDFGPDWLYLLPAPLDGRGARTNAAKPKTGTVWASLAQEEYESVSITRVWDSVPADGKTTPTRDGAMGGSAKNYAAFCYDGEFAEARSWEWLHIVAHSLGGNNEVSNLIAGTYTANTQMIPYESAIKSALLEGAEVFCVYTYECYPESRVGMYIEMEINVLWPNNASRYLKQQFNCTGDLPFDKFQYKMGQYR